jgi:hypothetical protein
MKARKVKQKVHRSRNPITPQPKARKNANATAPRRKLKMQ